MLLQYIGLSNLRTHIFGDEWVYRTVQTVSMQNKSLFRPYSTDFIVLKKAPELIHKGKYRVRGICYLLGINLVSCFVQIIPKSIWYDIQRFMKNGKEKIWFSITLRVCGEVSTLLLRTILGGRHTHRFGKYPGKIKGIIITNLGTNLIDFHISKVQVMTGPLYPHMSEVSEWWIFRLLVK